MDILSLIGWRTEALEKASESRVPSLEVGDRLQGRVARLLSQNLALVDLLGGRFKAVAELKTPLDPGQRLIVKVTATTPQIILQVVADEKSPGGPAAPTGNRPGPATLQVLTPQQTRNLIAELKTLAAVLKGASMSGNPGGTDSKIGPSGPDPFSNTGDRPPPVAPEAIKVSVGLERLAGHLASLDPKGDPKATAAQLQAHVRDGGQLFLQKLVDIVQGKGFEQAVTSEDTKGAEQVKTPRQGMVPEQVKTPEQRLMPEQGRGADVAGNKIPRILNDKLLEPKVEKAPTAIPIPGDKAPPAADGKMPPLAGDRLTHGLGARLSQGLGDRVPPGESGPIATGTPSAEIASAASKTPLSHLLQVDLKPHLQRLLIQLPTLMETLDPSQNLSAEGSRHLWSTVAALLEEMESGQTRLTEHRPEDPPVAMRHSMWVEGRDDPLRLNVYLPRKGRKKDPGAAPMVSLLLDLERFGAVRVDVRDQQQQLRVKFLMNSQAAYEDLVATVAPLEGILETLYPQVDLSVALAPEKVAAFDQDAGAVGRTGTNTGKLDIRI